MPMMVTRSLRPVAARIERTILRYRMIFAHEPQIVGGCMKVGVLGSGEVGTILAAGFQAHGHQVMVGARTAAKLDDWAKQNPKIQIGTFAAAAAFGELVVLAVKGSAAPEALRAATAKTYPV